MAALRESDAKGELLIVGNLSKQAHAGLIDAGWKVRDRLIDTHY